MDLVLYSIYNLYCICVGENYVFLFFVSNQLHTV